MRLTTRAVPQTLLVLASGFYLTGCASPSVLPETAAVQVAREAPKNCETLGKVNGTTSSVKGTAEQALEDMKKEAADKGATHVIVLQYSPNRTSVTGEAFQCH